MSRSTKKALIKDAPRNFKKSTIYWRTIRRVINYTLRKFRNDVDEMILPKEKSIVNDYNYSDHSTDCRFEKNCYCMRTYGTKKCKRK